MQLLGFCFSLTDGQGALKLNSALIALCHLKFYLLHRFCLQVSGFRTFGSFFSLPFFFSFISFLPLLLLFFFSELGEIKNIVILCDWEVFIATPCPEKWRIKKKNYVFKVWGKWETIQTLHMLKYQHLINKSNQKYSVLYLSKKVIYLVSMKAFQTLLISRSVITVNF